MTNFKEMILTEAEKEVVISNFILQEKRKKEYVFGKKVRDFDSSLIEYDYDELINNANEKKHYENEMDKFRIEQNLRVEVSLQEFNDYWTYQRMYSLLNSTSYDMGVKFEYNDDNMIAVQALCYFLSNDSKFESDLGYDQKKGIILRGKYGVGKTHIVRCLKDNNRRPISMYSMVSIKEKIANEGFHHIGSPKNIIYIDDVGSEDLPLMHYGNKINWFKDFIEKRYYMNEGFENIIISTNLSIKEMTEKYGERVTDRIAEMFNIIDVFGSSKRIEKVKERKNAIKKAIQDAQDEIKP